MKHIGRRRAALLAVAGLTISGVAAYGPLVASGDIGIGDSPTLPFGTLTLQLTDRAGTITFTEAGPGGETFTQAVGTSTPCSTIVTAAVVDGAGTTVPGNLLSFSATGGVQPSAQLPSNGIGVTDGANCGTPAGLVGPGQTLSVTLGNFFASEIQVTSATLAIGKSHQQDGNLRLGFDGGPLGSPITIARTGQSVNVNAPFDHTVTLASTATQSSRGLSLTSPTVFELAMPLDFDTTIDCGGTYDVEGDLGEGSAASTATFTRSETNGKSDDDCEPAGLSLRITDEGVFYDNGTIGTESFSLQDVTGFLTIDWTPVDPNESERLERTINFFPDVSDEEDDYVPVVWCLGFEDDGTPIHPADASFAGGVVPWCLVGDDRELTADGITQTQLYHGSGDPFWK